MPAGAAEKRRKLLQQVRPSPEAMRFHKERSEPFPPWLTARSISLLPGFLGATWDQVAAFVGHLDRRTTQRYVHFMPKGQACDRGVGAIQVLTRA